MTSLVIELSDSDYQLLATAAAAERITVPELLSRLAHERAEFASDVAAAGEAAQRHMRLYPSLFHRLAE